MDQYVRTLIIFLEGFTGSRIAGYHHNPIPGLEAVPVCIFPSNMIHREGPHPYILISVNDPGIDLPKDKSNCDISVILKRSLKNYSYAVLYEGRSIKRIWIRKDGEKSDVRISSPQPVNPVHESSEQDTAYSELETRNNSSWKKSNNPASIFFHSQDSSENFRVNGRIINPFKNRSR